MSRTEGVVAGSTHSPTLEVLLFGASLNEPHTDKSRVCRTYGSPYISIYTEWTRWPPSA